MATETKQVEDPQRLGLVLSGGGARGAFQVGVYERLLADPRFSQGPAILSGTSAGAINAALIAAGRTPQEMLRFWHGLAERPPAVASDSFMHHARQAVVALAALEPGRWVGESSALAAVREHLRHHLPLRPGAVLAWMLECAVTARFEVLSELLERIPDAHLFDTGPLRERLIEEFGGERIPHRPGVELAINVVDAPSGRAVRFVTKATHLTRPPEYKIVDAISVDMVLASASIPLLFSPVQVDHRLLWDGGLLVNTPLAPVVDLGADAVVTVLVTEPTDPTLQRFTHFGDALERVIDCFLENTYNVDRKLLLERNRLVEQSGGRYRPVRLYEAIRPARSNAFTAGSYLNFSHGAIQAMYESGLQAGAEWLAKGPPVDRLHERPWTDAPRDDLT